MQLRSEAVAAAEASENDLIEVSMPEEAELLRVAATELYSMRRRRDKYLPTDLMGEPVWEILLTLIASSEPTVTSGSLCGASAAPSTTALRWLTVLTGKGLIKRVAKPTDGDQRSVHYALTAHGRTIVEQALRAMLRD